MPQNSLMRDVPLPGGAAFRSSAAPFEAPAAAATRPVINSLGQTEFRLGTAQPPAVTLLQELLGPSVAVATLATCMWLDSSHFSSGFLALALITFVLSDRILTTPELRATANGERELQPSLPRLLLQWGIIFALLLFLITTLGVTHLVGVGALTAWFFITPAALMASNFAATRLARWWTTSRDTTCRHIIIGATDAGLELAKRVQEGTYSGRFLGFFDFRDPSRLPQLAPEQWAGTCAEVVDFVRRNAVDAIYIALPISTEPRMAQLLQQLRDTTASIYLVPANIFAFNLVQPRCVEIHGIPALAVCETPHRGMPGLSKRVFDIVLALVGLPIAAPLLLFIAAAVKLTSGGPVLFKQRRYGLNGEEIYVYKFRTMTVCEDGTTVAQATRNDERCTSLGRFLRRTSLDELPQILNVLAGQMSFVGPRPHAVAHNEQYRKLISGYMVRHKVRPGITGWAQVHGLRGETDTLDKMHRRIEYDIDYLNNWSLWLDLKILCRSVPLVVRGDKAY